MMPEQPKILIIGLGQIGYHNAEYFSNLGLSADGFDLDPKAISRAVDAGVIRGEAQTFAGYDHYLICVSTHNPYNMEEPSFSGLLEIAKRLDQEATEGGLVSIESTIAKGISNKVLEIMKHRLHVAHVPHRFYSGDKGDHGVAQLRVLGGCKNCCTLEALKLYARTLRIPVHTVKSIEIAELSKIIENSHRFVEIAFAEELKMFCDNEKLDFEELRKAVNSKWNIEILEARQGIGGHCLPKDTQMYFEVTKRILPSEIVSGAIQSNKNYTKHLERALQFIVIPQKEQIIAKTM